MSDGRGHRGGDVCERNVSACVYVAVVLIWRWEKSFEPQEVAQRRGRLQSKGRKNMFVCVYACVLLLWWHLFGGGRGHLSHRRGHRGGNVCREQTEHGIMLQLCAFCRCGSVGLAVGEREIERDDSLLMCLPPSRNLSTSHHQTLTHLHRLKAFCSASEMSHSTVHTLSSSSSFLYEKQY